MLDTRAIRSADIASDHHLVCTKLRLKLKAAPKRRGIRRTRYDTQKLENDGCRRKFRLELRNRFEILQREELEDDETDQAEAELEKANGILEKAYNMTAIICFADLKIRVGKEYSPRALSMCCREIPKTTWI